MKVIINDLTHSDTAYNYALAIAAGVGEFQLKKGKAPKLVSSGRGRWLWLKRQIDIKNDAGWLMAVIEKEEISVSHASLGNHKGEWTARCPANTLHGFSKDTEHVSPVFKWAVIGALLDRLHGSIDLPDDVYAVYLAETKAYKDWARKVDSENPTMAEIEAMGAFDGVEFS
ncbi:hypothetical protein ELY33_17155 [Vreelandella andesensis]|uniref:Uncharacterized protein n=1 Tax=Vreelandella andesensis TaxID=447567 RepID=A0A3S0Y0C2_9GAMM|nr:hypothetical protein [Halomonas andesensis]RUR26836.1 hypothetical protein ELY33_17155 [Halomonas andesensis]